MVWILAANGIYSVTLGSEAPDSVGAFVREVLTTGAGWAMIIVGVVVGFLFAAAVLAISVVSFPLLLDRDVGLPVGGPDLDPGRHPQSDTDRHLGAHRGGVAGRGFDSGVPGIDRGAAGARPRDVAPLSQDRGAKLVRWTGGLKHTVHTVCRMVKYL